ncbi:hypothetical protein MTR_5g053850 [Medicago truncatula]|uniref:Uncharacterized protein n=1 Tax=Medicago truncatula TaxID=3880 RepID=G7JX67_MEDTR|nr:hypothetical protein MTR_5g053850 [Medicago truncatula]
MGFRSEIELNRQLVEEAKVAKGCLEGVHGRACGGTGRAKLLTWGLYIFAPNLRIFCPNQLQISFLLLQDSIFRIFVHEIK